MILESNTNLQNFSSQLSFSSVGKKLSVRETNGSKDISKANKLSKHFYTKADRKKENFTIRPSEELIFLKDFQA